MIVTTLDVLARLSKEELWEAALDKQNTPDIQDIALRKWMVLDERDHRESMARMHNLVRQYWEVVQAPGPKRQAR